VLHRRHDESQASSRNQKQGSRRLTRHWVGHQKHAAREDQALFQRLYRVKLVFHMYRKVIRSGVKGLQSRRNLLTAGCIAPLWCCWLGRCCWLWCCCWLGRLVLLVLLMMLALLVLLVLLMLLVWLVLLV